MGGYDGLQLGSEGVSRCADLAEGLSAYVDGAADLTLSREIEAHVLVCAACAADLARLRALVRDLQALAEAPPPERAWDRVRAGLATGEERRPAGLLAGLQRALLFLYDRDLADRVARTGKVRAGARTGHDRAVLALGALLSIAPLLGSPALHAWPVVPLIALLWLASTRLEDHSAGEMAALALFGAGPGIAYEVHHLVAGLWSPAAGLCGAVVTLATAQAACSRSSKLPLLGGLHVAPWLRAATVVIAVALLGRGDLGWPLLPLLPAAIVGSARGAAWRRRTAA